MREREKKIKRETEREREREKKAGKREAWRKGLNLALKMPEQKNRTQSKRKRTKIR